MNAQHITPTTEVNIWIFDGTIKAVKLITLTAWAIALKSELKGYQVSQQAVEPIVRKWLGCPSDYPLDDICQHINDSLASVQNQI